VRLSLRVAIITFVLTIVFIFFPAALVFIIIFFLIWLLSQETSTATKRSGRSESGHCRPISRTPYRTPRHPNKGMDTHGGV